MERTFNDFDEYWELNAGSMAIKPLFDKLEPEIVESIKTSIQKKLTAQSTDGKIVIYGHVNAIKGIVWYGLLFEEKLRQYIHLSM